MGSRGGGSVAAKVNEARPALFLLPRQGVGMASLSSWLLASRAHAMAGLGSARWDFTWKESTKPAGGICHRRLEGGRRLPGGGRQRSKLVPLQRGGKGHLKQHMWYTSAGPAGLPKHPSCHLPPCASESSTELCPEQPPLVLLLPALPFRHVLELPVQWCRWYYRTRTTCSFTGSCQRPLLHG